jgi:hypothetical protein
LEIIKGFYGEILPANSGCTIVQKTHESDFKSYQKNSPSSGRAIIILRNPYKALISYRNLHFTNDYDHISNGASTDSFSGPGIFYDLNNIYFPHTHETRNSTFLLSTDCDNFVSLEVISWKSKVIQWVSEKVNGGEDIHVFHYENFISNDRAHQFRKIVSSLNLTVDEHRFNCTLKHGYDAFKRKPDTKTRR